MAKLSLSALRLDRQSQVIILAYAIFCLGLLLTSLHTLSHMRRLLTSAETLYEHPFRVSKDAQEARLAVKAIRDDLLFAVLSRDVNQARRNRENIDKQALAVDAALEEMGKDYLGDPADMARARALFADWKPVRDVIMEAAASGDFERARAVVLSTGTPAYERVDQELGRIIALSHDHAAELVRLAQDQRRHFRRDILLVMVGGFLASFLTSAVVIRRMRQAVRGQEEAMERMAHIDPLTGLPNRRLLADRLKQALLLAERGKSAAALFYLDLDHFKDINDTYGHEAGDAVLAQAAAALSACVRKSDTVARLGGDEFVVLVQQAGDRADLAALAEKIIHALSAPVPFGGAQLKPGASVGVAVYPQDAANPEALLHAADAAMYTAKKTGQGRFHFAADA